MAPSLLPVLTAAARRRERVVLDAFRAAGADTPVGAVLLGALSPRDPAVLARLVDRGRGREGAPGTFYAYTPPDGRRPPLLVGKLLFLLFLLFVLLLPVLLLQFTGGAR